MGFKILTGTDFDEDFLPRVMDLDRDVYEEKYAGELQNMVDRYRANRDSFVCIFDEAQDRLAGYINFFPCTPQLCESLRTTTVIRDDDIAANEIAQYVKGKNHLFVISIAMAREYRNGEAIVALSDAWIAHLNGLVEQGYEIEDITAMAVSSDGRNALRNYMFTVDRKLDDGNIVYVCEGKGLQKLLAHDLYFKSYKSDVYLFLPLADNVRNSNQDKLNEVLLSKGVKLTEDEIPQKLFEGLQDCLQYEMSNAVLEELDMAYLGEFDFLHTTDDYPQGGEEREKEIVVGEEKVYALLTAHRPSHIYVLLLFFPETPYSTTQIQDQLFYGYLKIRVPETEDSDRYKTGTGYVDLYEYLRLKYGLLKCGDGKSLICLSQKPSGPWEQEFRNIMSGEVYNSMHIDYHICSREIDEICNTDHAQYDYYEVYLSDVTIALILKDFCEDVLDRIEITATYAFIAQLVMFQNTALAKTNIKVTNALANSGDISTEEIYELYREFGKTVRFWEVRNFKYNGTQAEAECITKAFSNEELRQAYYEHQQFLEHIVELKTAQTEATNGTILNIVATVLAVIQIQDFAVELLASFYSYLGIEAMYAQKTFTTVIISGTLTILILYMILKKKKRNMSRRSMMHGKK